MSIIRQKTNTERRPLSPHLTIYKPQITSLLSILHRITGAYLYVGLILLSWWVTFSIYSGFDENVMQCCFVTSWIGRLMIFCWSLSLYYHFFNGIRHLFWDAGYGFEISNIYKTGTLVIIFTVIVTIITWGLALN